MSEYVIIIIIIFIKRMFSKTDSQRHHTRIRTQLTHNTVTNVHTRQYINERQHYHPLCLVLRGEEKEWTEKIGRKHRYRLQVKSFSEKVGFELRSENWHGRTVTKGGRKRVPNWWSEKAEAALTSSFHVEGRNPKELLRGGAEPTRRDIDGECTRQIWRQSAIEALVSETGHHFSSLKHGHFH